MRDERCRAVMTILCGLLFAACRTLPPTPQVVTTLAGPERIDKYGGLHFDISSGEFLTNGFSVSDTVLVSIAGNEVFMPVVANYRHVAPGEFALVASPESTRPLFTTIFYGDAATRLGIAHKLTTNGGALQVWQPASDLVFPLPVTIRLEQRGEAPAGDTASEPTRTNARSDYPNLTDAQFANFRAVNAPDLATGVLYRSSSPIDPILGRNAFADAAARAVGIRSVVNMVNSADEARALPGWNGSYAAGCATFFRPMAVDVTASDFAADIADSFRFIATNATPCLLHCKEGKDRTGFACALLALLFGATLDEAAADYLETFRNYYGQSPDSPEGMRSRETFFGLLRRAFRLKDLEGADLRAAARDYLLRAGLSPDEIAALKARLRNRPSS